MQKEWVVGDGGYMDTSANKDSQFASRSVVMKFSVDALIISPGQFIP